MAPKFALDDDYLKASEPWSSLADGDNFSYVWSTSPEEGYSDASFPDDRRLGDFSAGTQDEWSAPYAKQVALRTFPSGTEGSRPFVPVT